MGVIFCADWPHMQNLEAVLFNSPNSRAKTLQSYYSECSQGLSNMNSSNSRVGRRGQMQSVQKRSSATS